MTRETADYNSGAASPGFDRKTFKVFGNREVHVLTEKEGQK